MKLSRTLRTIIMAVILILMIYALFEGIKNGNSLGMVLAIGSMFAFGVCIHLARKLVQLSEEEDQ